MTKINLKRFGLGLLIFLVIAVIIFVAITIFSGKKDVSTKEVNTLRVENFIAGSSTIGEVSIKDAKIEKVEVENETIKKQVVTQQDVAKQNVQEQQVKIAKVENQKVTCQEVQRQCLSNQVCQSGRCVTQKSSCNNDCSCLSQRRCAPSCLLHNQYQICGNYDSDPCFEWSPIHNCPANQTCQNGQCIAKCSSHYTKRCYNNDLYWYNSCNVKEAKYKECGSGSLADNYRCSGNWIQKQIEKRGCTNNLCYVNSQWQNYQDCSVTNQICQNGQCIEQKSSFTSPPSFATVPGTDCPTCRPGQDPF